MASFDAELREIHPKTRAGWRSWLDKNHDPLYSAKREETRARRIADALAALEGDG